MASRSSAQGETDISNASRPIKDEEKAVCEENGIEYTELQVATDALTVVVSAGQRLHHLPDRPTSSRRSGSPAAEGKVTTWDQVNPEFPAETIELYGPGTDSGTFDYFTDEINGEEGASRTDYNASEDDNVIVQGVVGSRERARLLRLHLLRGERRRAQGGRDRQRRRLRGAQRRDRPGRHLHPAARPLFIYVANKAYADKPQVKAFVDFYAENDADDRRGRAVHPAERRAAADRSRGGRGDLG